MSKKNLLLSSSVCYSPFRQLARRSTGTSPARSQILPEPWFRTRTLRYMTSIAEWTMTLSRIAAATSLKPILLPGHYSIRIVTTGFTEYTATRSYKWTSLRA